MNIKKIIYLFPLVLIVGMLFLGKSVFIDANIEYRDISSLLFCDKMKVVENALIDSQEKFNELGCEYTTEESIDFGKNIVLGQLFIHGGCPEYYPKFKQEETKITHSIILESDFCEAIVTDYKFYSLSDNVIKGKEVVMRGIQR